MMDPTIEPMISGYGMGVDSYAGKLGEDHPKILAARECMARLRQIGEASGDVMAFMTASQEEMGKMNVLLGELATAEPMPSAATGSSAAGGVAPGGEVDPQVRQCAAGYHLAYDAMDKSDPDVRQVYERVFAIEKEARSAPTFLRMMAHENLFTLMSSVGMRAGFKQGKATYKAGGAVLPTSDYYFDTLEMEMAQAASPTHVEYIGNLQAEYNMVENEWDNTLVAFLTKAIGEVAGFYMDPSDTQQKNVVAAYRFTCAFFGMNWEQVYEVPRVKMYWENLFDHTKTTWASERNCHTVEEAWAFHTKTFYGVMEQMQRVPVAAVPIGPVSNQTVYLWKTPVHVNSLLETYASPPRPPVDLDSWPA